MKSLVVSYVATLAAFLLMDGVWLSRMADVLYRPAMGSMVLSNFRPAPAIVFYLIYVGGLVYFAVEPGLNGEAKTAALNGALLGLVAYATYDLTNHATLKEWSTALTVGDMAWGTIASSLAAIAGRWITLWLVGAR